MCKRLVLLTSFVLALMMVASASADLTVAENTTHTLDDDLTDSGLVSVAGHLIVDSGNILFQSRSDLDGPNNVGTGGTRPEITVNGGNFHIDARFDMGQGDDAYLTMNGGLFRVGNETSAGDSGDLKFPDDPGGTHRIWLNGGILRVHRLQLDSGRDPQIIVGGGVLQIENLGEGDPAGWLTEINEDINEPVLVPAEGFIAVVITYDVPVAGGAQVSAIAAGPYAEDPDPGRGATGVCPAGLVLSWTPTEMIADPNHDVYLDPDSDDVAQATRDSHGDVLYYSENQDSNDYTVPAALQLNTTYYWRVDEVDNAEEEVWESPFVWSFTTEDGNAFDPDPPDGRKGVNPAGVVLSWTPSCIATAQQVVYFSTDFNDVNTMQPGAIEDTVSATDNNCPVGTLDTYKSYYWRIKTDTGGDGEVWMFRTGYGGLVAKMTFEGSLGADLPATELDTSGNNLHFTTFSALHDPSADGSVKYADGRFSGTSADFEPNAGLYRLDTGTGDPLRLDGYQYTVEMWIKPETLTDAYGDITLIGKPGESSWRLRIVDPGGNNELQQTHNGNNETEGQVQVGEWQHIAAVYDQLAPDEEQMRLYYNGDLINTNDEGPNPSGNSDPVGIGMERRADGNTAGYFDGLIDEVKIWDIIVLPSPGCSTNPNPPHMADRVDPCDTNDTVLTWTPGPFADHHDVYFGTDANVVYQGTVDGNMYPEAGNLVLQQGKTYYWRIDDVDDDPSATYEGFLWSFSTEAVIVDPNMIVWYKFDETSGDEVTDSSGYYNHGSIDDDQDDTWDPCDGRFPGCISFHEEERVDIDDNVFNYLGESISISVWWKDAWRDGDENDHLGFGTDDLQMLVRAPDSAGGNPGVIWQAGNDTNDLVEWKTNADTWKNDWHHLVFTKNGPEGTMKIYFDTVVVAETSEANGTTLGQAAAANEEGFRIGANYTDGDSFLGKADDFRVYDYEIPQSKVDELFRGGDVEYAWAPEPIDGGTDVPRDANLTWKPGDYTDTHNVYFGTSWDDVNSATTVDKVATKNLGDEEYDPGLMELGQTYYWRIDEVNEPATYKGKVWSFTVAQYVTLDDFEQYDLDQKGIQYTWYDQYSQEYGQQTGAWLELAQAPRKPVYRGEQAMSYTYDTDDPWADYYYAEAWLPLEEIGGFQDWTSVDVRLLTVFFYGLAGNDATQTEQMYIGVDDTWDTYAEIRYGDNEGEAWSDIQVEEWQRWDIPFIYFSDGNFAAVPDDVDFSSIANVYIGFGNKLDPVAAGKGIVFFDDLLLSMPICKPEFGPVGDLDDDCIIGMGDVGAMGEQWLRGDVNVTPVTQPSDANRVARWQLDGNANDSWPNAYHGTAEGAYEWVAGKDGQAIDLSGGWVVVDDNGVTPKLRPKHYVSVMAWIYIDGDVGEDMKVVIKGENDRETFGLEVDNEDGAAFIMRDANDLGNVLSVQSGGGTIAGKEWIHIAGTYDNNDQVVYVNGVEEASETRGAIELFSDANDGLGIGGRYGDGASFDGKIDDVRVYDRAVSRAEIAWLASGGDGIVELASEANLYSGEDDEVINFRDFAKLLESWGVEQLWPPEP
ncbi:MAG TPA: LamG domain-containing protein [Sedimentisphaerales bacterium]|nr:LamG domain-containing protein [Sedimentisphaerales bacterium]